MAYITFGLMVVGLILAATGVNSTIAAFITLVSLVGLFWSLHKEEQNIEE